MQAKVFGWMTAAILSSSLLASCGGSAASSQTNLLATTASTTPTCTLQAEDYSAAYDTTPGNAGGQYRSGDVDIEVTTDVGSGYDVGWTDTGEWLAHYNVTFPTSGLYTFQYRVASPNSNGVISSDLNAGSIQLGKTAIPNTGGWQNWTTVERTFNINAGTYNVGTFISTGGFNLNWIKIVGASCNIPPAGRTLVWSDEFNGTSLDPSKWNIEVSGTGGGNNELQYYTARPENVSVSGGNLVITARQETYTGPDGTRGYTSGRINTKGLESWTYGRMEARMKLPAGQGLWPAFWMLGANLDTVGWPKSGEIDIMEHVNTEALVHGTIHWADANGNHVYYGGPSGNVDVTQWHVYAVEWDTNAIRWYVDGNLYLTANIQNNINNTGAFHNPFFLIFNLAVGGDWPGNPNGSVAFPQQMLVDYVRVYR